MKKESGFTLIEIIVTLIIVGIIATMAGMGIASGIKGYMLAKGNAAITQKSQMALARVSRELMELVDVTTAQPSRVTYSRFDFDSGNIVSRTVYLDSGSVKIASGSTPSGGDTIVDDVGSFTLNYYKGTNAWQITDDIQLLSAIRIVIGLTNPGGGSDISFSTTATPRNNKNAGGAPPPSPQSSVPHCFISTASYGWAAHLIAKLSRSGDGLATLNGGEYGF